MEQSLRPRSTFNVKCLEILGSVSFLLNFIVLLKIAENTESGVVQQILIAKQLGKNMLGADPGFGKRANGL